MFLKEKKEVEVCPYLTRCTGKKGGCLIFTSYGGTYEAQIASAPIWAGIGFVLK